MAKRRVALLSESDLLGESLEHVLRGVEDAVLLGPWAMDHSLLLRLSQNTPDLLVIAQDQEAEERVSQLVVQILHAYPELPIIQITPDRNEMLVYTSKIMHATSSDLIDLIHRLPYNISFDKVERT